MQESLEEAAAEPAGQAGRRGRGPGGGGCFWEGHSRRGVLLLPGPGKGSSEPSETPVTLAPSTYNAGCKLPRGSGPRECAELCGAWSEGETWPLPAEVKADESGWPCTWPAAKFTGAWIRPGRASLRSWHWSQALGKSRVSINTAHRVGPSRPGAQPGGRAALRGQCVPLQLGLQNLLLGAPGIFFLLGWGMCMVTFNLVRRAAWDGRRAVTGQIDGT